MILMPNPDQTDCISASSFIVPVDSSLEQFGTFYLSFHCNTEIIKSLWYHFKAEFQWNFFLISLFHFIVHYSSLFLNSKDSRNVLSLRSLFFSFQATFPCQNDPCKPSQICSINEDCSFGRQSKNCRPYLCLPGCSLGVSATIKVRNLDLFKVRDKLYIHLLQ